MAFHPEKSDSPMPDPRTLLSPCRLCPRECGAERASGETGFCGLDAGLHLSHAGLHFGEEPCFTGQGGVANFFFSGCNLACVFCQNHQISQGRAGDREISPGQFAREALALQEAGAAFLGLVTPSPQIPQVREALLAAREAGLTLKVLYNSSAFESVKALRSLEGLVDVYLPDFKYGDEVAARFASNAPGYFEAAQEAVLEMHRQAGDLVLDPDTGLAVKGLFVRHLVLPRNLAGTWEVFCFLALEVSTRIGLSVMAQYNPMHRAAEFPPLDQPVTREEYDRAVDMAVSLGFEHIQTQDLEQSPANAVPDFTDRKNPFKGF